MTDAAYQPMVIQYVIGQPWQRHEASPMLYAALEWISRKLETALWNRLQRQVPNPFHKDERTKFDTEGLSIHGYDRDDEEFTQPWNLKCGELEISWYRHSWCGVSVNRSLTNDEIAEFLETALAIVERCNADLDYRGKKGEQAFLLDGEPVGESLYQQSCREDRAQRDSGSHRNGEKPEALSAEGMAERPCEDSASPKAQLENSMSKNMVERVARGIWTAPITGQPLGGEVRPWPPTDPDALTETYNQARAAIEAMASPTEAMVEAAHIAEPNPVLGGYALEEDGPGTIWNAMITAALKP